MTGRTSNSIQGVFYDLPILSGMRGKDMILLQFCPGCGTKHCAVSTTNPDFTLHALLCENCDHLDKPAATKSFAGAGTKTVEELEDVIDASAAEPYAEKAIRAGEAVSKLKPAEPCPPERKGTIMDVGKPDRIAELRRWSVRSADYPQDATSSEQRLVDTVNHHRAVIRELLDALEKGTGGEVCRLIYEAVGLRGQIAAHEELYKRQHTAIKELKAALEAKEKDPLRDQIVLLSDLQRVSIDTNNKLQAVVDAQSRELRQYKITEEKLQRLRGLLKGLGL